MSKFSPVIVLFSIFSLTLSAFSKEGELNKNLSELQATTERQLALQKEMISLVEEFKQQQDLFYKGPQTKELASKMVTTASTILKMAEENHYLHLFPPFDVEELKLFANIAKKKNPLAQ
jgi:hypothetical protein